MIRRMVNCSLLLCSLLVPAFSQTNGTMQLETTSNGAGLPSRPGTVETFEAFAVPGGAASNLDCSVLNSTATCNGQGPGLVVAGVNFIFGGLGTWNGANYSGFSRSKEILSNGQPLTIDFTTPVTAVAVTLRAFAGFTATATLTIYGLDDMTEIGTLPDVVLDGISPAAVLDFSGSGTLGPIIGGTACPGPQCDPLMLAANNASFSFTGTIDESLSPNACPAGVSASVCYTIPAGGLMGQLGNNPPVTVTTPSTLALTIFSGSSNDLMEIDFKVPLFGFQNPVTAILDLAPNSFGSNALIHPEPFTPSPQALAAATSAPPLINGSSITYCVINCSLGSTVLGLGGTASTFVPSTSPAPVRVGWQDDAGIGKIVLTQSGQAWSPIIDNLEFAATTAKLTLSPNGGFPGAPVTITGAGFAASETIKVICYYGSSFVDLGTLTADASGAGSTIAHVPPVAHGTYLLYAIGQSSGLFGAALLSITPILSMNPNTGTVGSTVVAQGFGFGAGEPVQVYWNNPRIFLGTATANNRGSFLDGSALTIMIPTDAPTGPNAVFGVGQSTKAIGKGWITVQ